MIVVVGTVLDDRQERMEILRDVGKGRRVMVRG